MQIFGRGAALLLATGATLAVLLPAVPASAAPQSLTVQPRAAPVGTPLTVSGTGCADDVAIHVVAFHLPRGAFVVADLVATPGPAGDWTVQLPMPDAPVYVEATCDGVTAIPVVVSPTDIEPQGGVAPVVSATSVVIRMTHLVEGSQMLVRTRTGTTLGVATVDQGSATVTLPRSQGPATVVATALQLPTIGVPLPYTPVARAVELPFAQSPSVVASPRVAAPGAAVSVLVTGCPGQMAVRVTGQAMGFRDVPRLYATRNATLPPPGRFTFTLPMPSEPATIFLTCTQGALIERATTITAPSTWSGRQAVVVRQGDSWLLTVQTFGSVGPPPPAAFTLTGVSVPIVRTGAGVDGLTFRIAGTVRGKLLVLAEEEIPGEDAEALQKSRPQAWFADLGPGPVPTPTAPVPPPADPAPSGAGGVSPPPGVNDGAVLAVTGARGVVPAATAGAAAILIGCLLIAASRRPRRR